MDLSAQIEDTILKHPAHFIFFTLFHGAEVADSSVVHEHVPFKREEESSSPRRDGPVRGKSVLLGFARSPGRAFARPLAW